MTVAYKDKGKDQQQWERMRKLRCCNTASSRGLSLAHTYDADVLGYHLTKSRAGQSSEWQSETKALGKRDTPLPHRLPLGLQDSGSSLVFEETEATALAKGIKTRKRLQPRGQM